MNVQNVYHQIYKDRFEEKSPKKIRVCSQSAVTVNIVV